MSALGDILGLLILVAIAVALFIFKDKIIKFFKDDDDKKKGKKYKGSNPLVKTLVDTHNRLFFKNKFDSERMTCRDHNELIKQYLRAYLPVYSNDVAMAEFDLVLRPDLKDLNSTITLTQDQRNQYWQDVSMIRKYIPELILYIDDEGKWFTKKSPIQDAFAKCACAHTIGSLNNTDGTPGPDGEFCPYWFEGRMSGESNVVEGPLPYKTNSVLTDDFTKLLQPLSDASALTCEAFKKEMQYQGDSIIGAIRLVNNPESDDYPASVQDHVQDLVKIHLGEPAHENLFGSDTGADGTASGTSCNYAYAESKTGFTFNTNEQ